MKHRHSRPDTYDRATQEEGKAHPEGCRPPTDQYEVYPVHDFIFFRWY